jgi:hypothetical protein
MGRVENAECGLRNVISGISNSKFRPSLRKWGFTFRNPHSAFSFNRIPKKLYELIELGITQC